ncbi:hypothetical protein DFJ74DRAFT_102829 [Hyaloraphidium curvatum]|nr:hypothetical protein DFJ74DRAFT_102829 [Hyaloraphidium curvatum]
MGNAFLAACLLGATLLGAALLAAPAAGLSVPRLPLAEVVRRADGIFVGAVSGATSRRDGKFILTDVTYRVNETLVAGDAGTVAAATTVLTYWGGTIGDETQRIAGFEMPQPGRTYVLATRRRDGDTAPFPVVGVNQGQLLVDGAVLRDSGGDPLVVRRNGAVVLFHEAAAAPPGMAADEASRPASLADLKAYLASSRRTAILAAPKADFGFIASPPVHVPSPVAADEALNGANTTKPPAGLPRPAQAPAATTKAGPGSFGGAYNVAEVNATAIMPATRLGKRYNYLGGRWREGVTMNQWPAGYPSWEPRYHLNDQYTMAQWNEYVGLISIRGTPTSMEARSWNNGMNDMVGIIDDSVGLPKYNIKISDALGVAPQFFVGGFMVECDVLISSHYTWTSDATAMWARTTSANSMYNTLLHEVGHCLGLDHDHFKLSAMNYGVGWSGLPYVFMDDIQGLRALYPSRIQTVTDFAVYMFVPEGGEFGVPGVRLPTQVVAGDTMAVSRFWIENVGTERLNEITMNAYISTDLTIGNGNDRYMTTIYFPGYSMVRGQAARLDSDVSFVVPQDTDAGSYHIVFAAQNNGMAHASIPAGTFPGYANSGNHIAFSREKVRVFARLESAWFEDAGSRVYSLTKGRAYTFVVRFYGKSDGASVDVQSAGLSIGAFTVYVPAGERDGRSPITLGEGFTDTELRLDATYGGLTVWASATVPATNPCRINNGGCFPSATCTNDGGWAVCRCPNGWTGDGYWCERRKVNVRLVVANASVRPGARVTLGATLTRADNRQPIAGVQLVFRVGSRDVGRANTNRQGIATFTYAAPRSLARGRQTITVRYGGSSSFNAGSGTARLTVS